MCVMLGEEWTIASNFVFIFLSRYVLCYFLFEVTPTFFISGTYVTPFIKCIILLLYCVLLRFCGIFIHLFYVHLFKRLIGLKNNFRFILRVICISTQNGSIKIMQMYTGLYLNLFPYDCVLSCYSMVHNIELNNNHKVRFLVSEIQMYMQTCLELNTYLYL